MSFETDTEIYKLDAEKIMLHVLDKFDLKSFGRKSMKSSQSMGDL